jgi:FMN phosphatase YigB (HAD superfamily)
MKKEKVILTDADGVLLDWEYAFDYWMHRHGYEVKTENVYEMDVKYDMAKPEMKRLIRMFNESAWIRKLPPLRDAIKYVKKLHEDHGFIFHCITSLSNDEYAQHLRTKNLREMFGDSTFEKYVYLDTGADKDEILALYKDTDCYWIEDKYENAMVGKNLGLDSILMGHGFNMKYETKRPTPLGFEGNEDAPTRVNNWKEIYNLITG